MSQVLHYDVVVIGAGMMGLSAAWELARQGCRVAVLERKRLGDSCSVSNTALVIKADMEPGRGLELTRASLDRFDTLGNELDIDLEYEQTDLIGVITDEAGMAEAREQVRVSVEAGFESRIVGPGELKRMEPMVDTEGLLGALVSRQAKLNPFHFLYGYYRAAVKNGMQWYPESKVTGFVKHPDYIEVTTCRQVFRAEKVILAAGAWTREVTALLGLDLPIHYVHGEAFVTEALPRLANGVIGQVHSDRVDMENEVCRLAEEGNWYGSESVLDCSEFVISQVANGNILIGQRSFAAPYLYEGLAKDSIAAMAKAAVKYLPALANASIIRSWACPVPFLPDHRALAGPVDDQGRIILSAGYYSTIVLTPAMGEQIAKMALGKKTDYDLGMFDPKRFLKASKS